MSQTQSSSRKRPYGLQRVCRVWQFPRSTVNEHRRRAALCPEERPEPKKRGPQGPCTDDELAEKIRQLLKASPFQEEGYRSGPSCASRTSARRRTPRKNSMS